MPQKKATKAQPAVPAPMPPAKESRGRITIPSSASSRRQVPELLNQPSIKKTATKQPSSSQKSAVPASSPPPFLPTRRRGENFQLFPTGQISCLVCPKDPNQPYFLRANRAVAGDFTRFYSSGTNTEGNARRRRSLSDDSGVGSLSGSEDFTY